MLGIIALILIIFGIYLIVKGLMEPMLYREYEEYKEYEYKYEEEKPKVKGGGIVLIGPIPIVFGNSKFVFYTLILAIVLILLSIIFILLVA
jgi:uncharacterized protein (TIGR00304 family)